MNNKNGLVVFKDLDKTKIKAEDLDNNFRRVNILDGENYIIERNENGLSLSFPFTAMKITQDETGATFLGAYKNGELKDVRVENIQPLGYVGSLNILGWWV